MRRFVVSTLTGGLDEIRSGLPIAGNAFDYQQHAFLLWVSVLSSSQISHSAQPFGRRLFCGF